MTLALARVLVALAMLALSGAPAPGAPAASTGALAVALASHGRAEATLRYDVPGADGTLHSVRARLSLERPDRARLDVAGSGERIVLRGDGGEWLQPATRQLLRFRAEQGAPVLRWWRWLMDPSDGARARPLGGRSFVLSVPAQPGEPADSAEVRLDASGLPQWVRVPARDPAGAVYRLSGWRFGPAHGAASFRLAAPEGWDTVDLP